MTNTIDTKILLAALKHLKTVSPRKSYPILENTKIDIFENLLKLTATDLDIQIVATIPVDADTVFSAIVNTKCLYDIINTAKNDNQTIELTMRDGALVIKTKALDHVIKSESLQDWPEFFDAQANQFFTMPSSFIAELQSINTAASTESTRYYLEGVSFHKPENSTTLVLVATDGHRLYKLESQAPEGLQQINVILPSFAIKLLSRFAKTSTDKIDMAISTRGTCFTFDTKDGTEYKITTKNIDGTYPDYNRVIPKRFPNETITFHSAQMLTAIKTVIVGDVAKSPQISITCDTNKIAIQNNSNIVNIENLDGKNVMAETRLNSKYLIDVLAQAGNGIITMSGVCIASRILIT